MSDSTDPNPQPMSRQDEQAALFGNLVVQQAQMALMLMGKIVNPETGKATKDLEAAQYFIDVLEMLEAKTKGNLSTQETGLVKQTLMTLRMAFFEAVEKPAQEEGAAKPAEPAPADPSAAATNDESRKKFSKKY